MLMRTAIPAIVLALTTTASATTLERAHRECWEAEKLLENATQSSVPTPSAQLRDLARDYVYKCDVASELERTLSSSDGSDIEGEEPDNLVKPR